LGHWGTVVSSSDDLGRHWSHPEPHNLKFPQDTGAALSHVWVLEPAPALGPEVVLAGTEPAALFRSNDAGTSFELVRGLWEHPQRPQWQPGFGGQCLHSVVVHPGDPRRMLVAISAAGIYRTEDGGQSWQPANGNIRAAGLEEAFPEFGQCVHRAAIDPAQPETVYIQSHGGLYRTDDFARSPWIDIAAGVPSDFGFPVVSHPRQGGTAYVIPLTADFNRWTVGGKCRVYRTTDAGKSWEPLTKGLPQRQAYLTVVRDAFCNDGAKGLYFGTRSGEVYGSQDEGESWRLVASRLPAVLSVRALAAA